MGLKPKFKEFAEKIANIAYNMDMEKVLITIAVANLLISMVDLIDMSMKNSATKKWLMNICMGIPGG